MYFLTGLIFQRGLRLGLSLERGEKEPVIQSGISKVAFFGILEHDEAEIMTGEILDGLGNHHKIRFVNLTEDEFEFTGINLNNIDLMMNYTLRKRGDWWAGRFESNGEVLGKIKCKISEIPQDFFDEPLDDSPALT